MKVKFNNNFKNFKAGETHDLDDKTAQWLIDNMLASDIVKPESGCPCDDCDKSTDEGVNAKDAAKHIEALAEEGEEGFEDAIRCYAEGDTRKTVLDAVEKYT